MLKQSANNTMTWVWCPESLGVKASFKRIIENVLCCLCLSGLCQLDTGSEADLEAAIDPLLCHYQGPIGSLLKQGNLYGPDPTDVFSGRDLSFSFSYFNISPLCISYFILFSIPPSSVRYSVLSVRSFFSKSFFRITLYWNHSASISISYGFFCMFLLNVPPSTIFFL